MKKTSFRFTFITGMILIAALSRILPHPPNFTPIAAMALFGGAYFTKKKYAFLIPLMGMLFSDLLLSFIHGYSFFSWMRPVIYGCFLLITTMGFWMRNGVKIHKIALTGFSGSVLFFVATNFAVWMGGKLYPITGEGLLQCYIAAIPFFRNTLIGDLFYAGVLFGMFELVKYKYPSLMTVKNTINQ